MDYQAAQDKIMYAVRDALSQDQRSAAYANDLALSVASGIASSLLPILSQEIQTAVAQHEAGNIHEPRAV